MRRPETWSAVPAVGMVAAITLAHRPTLAVTVSDVSSSASSPASLPQRVVRVCGMTDVGQLREHNEDAFLVANLETGTAVDVGTPCTLDTPRHGLLFLVADGMGGAASGELASSLAGECVLLALQAHWRSLAEPTPEAFAAALRDATQAANRRIHGFALEHAEHQGMGTTATVAGLLDDTLYIAQVGDSRAYLLRGGHAIQITKDQSLMQRLIEAGEITPQQAAQSEHRNIILQALGPEPTIDVDLTHQRVHEGDLLLLCSDGLSGVLDLEEMEQIAATAADVDQLCQALITAANAHGGPDNITVIAARILAGSADQGHAEHTVSYRTYPLAGTLYHPAPVASMPTEEIPAVRPTPSAPVALPDDRPEPPALSPDVAPAAPPLGAPPAVVDARRRALRPLQLVLGALALLALAWLVIDLRGR